MVAPAITLVVLKGCSKAVTAAVFALEAVVYFGTLLTIGAGLMRSAVDTAAMV